MADKPYPTDLTDQQWELIRPLLEHNHGQRGQQHYSLRRIVDGCFYVLRGGIPWRMMPHDLPPWEDVYYHLRTWRRKGTWERSNQVLRERHPVAEGRKPHPTAAVIDSQSVKTTEVIDVIEPGPGPQVAEEEEHRRHEDAFLQPDEVRVARHAGKVAAQQRRGEAVIEALEMFEA